MIKHIVVWRLKESAHGNTKMQNALFAKEKFEALNGKIEGMIRLEIGINFNTTDESSDIVLYSEFRSKQDLDNYQTSAEHQALMPFIREARTERRVIDYEA
jgi:hypothetical protein